MPVFAGTQYAVPTDLANLGLVGAALNTIPTGTQLAALAAASAIVDSKIAGRFVLPLAQWGNDLVRAVCVIAAYDLMTSRGYNPMAGADQNIRQRYLDALAWLDNVGQGTDDASYVIDSAVPTPDGDDDSDTTSIGGGFQMTTSNVRGWTDRGTDTTNDFDPKGWDC